MEVVVRRTLEATARDTATEDHLVLEDKELPQVIPPMVPVEEVTMVEVAKGPLVLVAAVVVNRPTTTTSLKLSRIWPTLWAQQYRAWPR